MGEVKDAGSKNCNGWYTRKDTVEGPPSAWQKDNGSWSKCNTGRHWYENRHNHYFIYQDGTFWYIHASDGRRKYTRACRTSYIRVSSRVRGEGPPRQGWSVAFRSRAPAPTLRVVDSE